MKKASEVEMWSQGRKKKELKNNWVQDAFDAYGEIFFKGILSRYSNVKIR